MCPGSDQYVAVDGQRAPRPGRQIPHLQIRCRSDDRPSKPPLKQEELDRSRADVLYPDPLLTQPDGLDLSIEVVCRSLGQGK
jgi:hypothetical protein